MDSRSLPQAPEELAGWLQRMHAERNKRQRENRERGAARRRLSPQQRRAVLASTGGRCHVCGGAIEPGERWEADHVMAHAKGGAHAAANFLPAHAACNKCRWDYDGPELQFILRLGVWVRTQMEKRTDFGRLAAEAFMAQEQRVNRRRQRARRPRGEEIELTAEDEAALDAANEAVARERAAKGERVFKPDFRKPTRPF